MPWPRAAAVLVAAIATSLGLSFGLGGVVGLASDEDADPASDFAVDWDYQPTDLADLVANSPAVVVAEVEAVRDGEPMAIGPADPSTGLAPSVPTQRIDLRVTEVIEGEAPDELTLFKLGGPGAQPDGSPRYEVGERDLLFVRPRLNEAGTASNPDGTWLAVAPEGRLERLDSGVLDSPTDGPIADELDGATLPEAVEAIDQAAGSDTEPTGEPAP
jgi:hypothetical protein